MRGKIPIMLALALLCGGGSWLAARNWLDAQASAAVAAIATPAPPAETGSIVVAAEPLGFGTALTTGNLKVLPWPADALPEGAFATIDAVVGAEPRAVLSPLSANEPVLAAKVTGPGERAGLSRLIGEGQRAVAIRVNDVAGVAGFVMPGDRVDVVLTVQREDRVTTDVILQGVKVLSVDQTADALDGAPVVAKAVTVEVDAAGAQKIALGQSIGSISLTLRRAGEDRAAAVETVTPDDIVPGASSPAAPASLATAAVAQVSSSTRIGVTRALERTEYTVPTSVLRLAPPPAAPAVSAPEVR